MASMRSYLSALATLAVVGMAAPQAAAQAPVKAGAERQVPKKPASKKAVTESTPVRDVRSTKSSKDARASKRGSGKAGKAAVAGKAAATGKAAVAGRQGVSAAKPGKSAKAGQAAKQDPLTKSGKAAKGAKKGKKDEGVSVSIKTKESGDKKDEEIPTGTDPSDIRAMRGSQAMRSVEKRLTKILGKMKIKGKHDFLPFDTIDNWIYEDGFEGMPKRIHSLNKKKVVMAGFMLPIDAVEDIKEFYLVKSLWSCCYGTPPDVNGLVKVRLTGKKGLDYQYDPLLLIGEFRVQKEMDDDYCVAIYQIDVEQVKVIDVDKLR